MSKNSRTPSTLITVALTGQTEFTIPFEYLTRRFVVLTLIGTDRRVLTLGTDYRFVNPTTVSLFVTPPAQYTHIEIQRVTSATDRLVNFQDGSILFASNLNLAQVQSLHIAEEARDVIAQALSIDSDGNLDVRGKRIINLSAGVSQTDAVNKRQLDELRSYNDDPTPFIWNRRVISADIGNVYANYSDGDRTLTPRLRYGNYHYLPKFVVTESLQITGAPNILANTDITVPTDKGDRVFSRMSAEAIARADDVGGLGLKVDGSDASRSLAQRAADTVCIKDFGAKGDGSVVPKAVYDAALAKCIATNSALDFPSGEYVFDYEVALPPMGAYGRGRRASVLKVTGTTAIGVRYNTLEEWGTGMGQIMNLSIHAGDTFTGSNLKVSTPSRGFTLQNVGLETLSGVCLELENSYYINHHNVAFSGKYRAAKPTNESERIRGIAVKITDREVNNLLFHKCDFRDLATVYKTATENVFQGSNTVKFTSCAIERIGDAMADLSGVWATFDNCYFELLDRNGVINQAAADPAKMYNTAMHFGGASNVVYENCLINLGSTRSDNAYALFRHMLGTIIIKGGATTGLSNFTGTVLGEQTFSGQGGFRTEEHVGLSECSFYAYQQRAQEHTRVGYRNWGPKRLPEVKPLMADAYKALRTHSWHQHPTQDVFSLNNHQPICLIDGMSESAAFAVHIKARILRSYPEVPSFGFEDLDISFVIHPNMAATLTPVVTSGGIKGDAQGFAGTLVNAVKVYRTAYETPVVGTAKKWAYQVAFLEPSGSGAGVRKTLCNEVEVSVMALSSQAVKSTIGIYEQSGAFVAPPSVAFYEAGIADTGTSEEDFESYTPYELAVMESNYGQFMRTASVKV